MAKGNRTNSRRDSTKIQALNQRYSEEVAQYKRFAEARRNSRKWTQEAVHGAYTGICEYIETQVHKGQPLTIAGVLLSIDMNRKQWDQAVHGELDYMLEEYIELHDTSNKTTVAGLPACIDNDGQVVMLIPYSDLAEKTMLRIQEQLEANLYTNKGNPAGSIFSLKHNYRWREDDTPQTVNNNLVIADGDQAKKAMAMLTNVEIPTITSND